MDTQSFNVNNQHHNTMKMSPHCLFFSSSKYETGGSLKHLLCQLQVLICINAGASSFTECAVDI